MREKNLNRAYSCNVRVQLYTPNDSIKVKFENEIKKINPTIFYFVNHTKNHILNMHARQSFDR